MNKTKTLRSVATDLRQRGYSYKEIEMELNTVIPKSTLSYWFKEVNLNTTIQAKFKEKNKLHLLSARKLAEISKKQKRESFFKVLYKKNSAFSNVYTNNYLGKIALAMLYLGEGGKRFKQSSVMFGNANPKVIKFFLHLLRKCYVVDETKFRCTVQCRSDQNIDELTLFWNSVTKIPLNQFYQARIDPRSFGKKTLKQDYKGVCRIDYFSSETFWDIIVTTDIICKGP